jgi:hypothetical protein
MPAGQWAVWAAACAVTGVRLRGGAICTGCAGVASRPMAMARPAKMTPIHKKPRHAEPWDASALAGGSPAVAVETSRCGLSKWV